MNKVPGLVSVIVPVRNRPTLLQEAVTSVVDQTYRPIECLVVDDGSTDETPEVARSLAQKHPGLVSVLQQSKQGPGPAREAGRLRARGEFIQYLDSDDFLHPNKFSDQIRTLRASPECGVAYGISRLTDINGNVLKQVYKWTAKPFEFLFPALLVDRWWCTHTPLYTRTVTDQVGSWSNFRYSQDWEYDARVAAQGTRIVSCETLVSDHRTHGGQRQTGHGEWLDASSQLLFFTKLYQCACAAGVKGDVPEMRHFSRWVFSASRKLAVSNNISEASRLLDLAGTVAGGPTLDMRLYDLAANLFGWSRVGRACAVIDRRKRRVGKRSMSLSWMNHMA